MLGGERTPGVITLFTPQIAEERSVFLRAALGVATVSVMGAAAIVGVTAFAALMMAMAVVWFLATQVLGLKVAFDPRAMYAEAQRQAQAAQTTRAN